jgi:hypothetical protein
MTGFISSISSLVVKGTRCLVSMRNRKYHRTQRIIDDIGEVSPRERLWSGPAHDITVPEAPELFATHPFSLQSTVRQVCSPKPYQQR